MSLAGRRAGDISQRSRASAALGWLAQDLGVDALALLLSAIGARYDRIVAAAAARLRGPPW